MSSLTDSNQSRSSTPPTSAYSGQPDKSTIRSYFDSIAYQYDFLNQFLSFKLDDSWRKRACRSILEGHEKTVLDLGVGTGKFLKLFLERKVWETAAGVDFSQKMLDEAQTYLERWSPELIQADIHHLPFKKESFDLIVSSFTLRSVQNIPDFVRNVYALLTPGGKAGFLCLTRPHVFWWNALYYPYLKLYLPLIGGLFSGNRRAYSFLSSSIQSFPDPLRTKVWMEEAGFEQVTIEPFHFGMATFIKAKKHG